MTEIIKMIIVFVGLACLWTVAFAFTFGAWAIGFTQMITWIFQ